MYPLVTWCSQDNFAQHFVIDTDAAHCTAARDVLMARRERCDGSCCERGGGGDGRCETMNARQRVSALCLGAHAHVTAWGFPLCGLWCGH